MGCSTFSGRWEFRQEFNLKLLEASQQLLSCIYAQPSFDPQTYFWKNSRGWVSTPSSLGQTHFFFSLRLLRMSQKCQNEQDLSEFDLRLISMLHMWIILLYWTGWSTRTINVLKKYDTIQRIIQVPMYSYSTEVHKFRGNVIYRIGKQNVGNNTKVA
jgi:hypothetical protein